MNATEHSKSGGIARVRVFDKSTGELKRGFTEENTLVIGVHELIVDLLNPEISGDIREPIKHLAIGDDDTTAEDYQNTTINNEIERLEISDYGGGSNDSIISVFISGSELIGQDIKEIGLTTENRLVNHFIFATEDQILDKTSQEVIVIDIILQWRAA